MMNLAEEILKRWRKVGLVSDNPTAVDREMAHEAAITVRLLAEKDEQYDISWRLVALIVICVFVFIFSMFYFLM